METKSKFIVLLMLCCLLFSASGANAATTQHYELLRSEQPFVDGAKRLLSQTNVLTYTDIDIRPNTRYYYWIRSVELTSTSKQIPRQLQPGFKVTATLKAPIKAPKNLVLPVFADLDYYGADNLWPAGYGERSLYETSETPRRTLIEKHLSAGGTGPGQGGRFTSQRYDFDLSSLRRSSTRLALMFRLDHQEPDETLFVETPALEIPLVETGDPSPGNFRATVSTSGIKLDWNAATGVSGWSQPLTATTLEGDLIPPTLTITGHTNNVTILTNSGSYSFSGTAADNTGVTKVVWSNHRGTSGTATGTTAWSVSNLPLWDGENQLRFTAVDAYGNETSQIVRVNHNSSTYRAGVWNWAYSLPGYANYSYYTAIDSRTNALVAGALITNVTFGAHQVISLGGPNTSAFFNGFLTKFSPSGAALWASALQSTNRVIITSLAIDSADNIVVFGYCKAPAIFGGYTLADTGGKERDFIAKYASNGSLLWVKTFTGTSDYSISTVKFDSADNLIFAGTYSSGTLFPSPHQLENQTAGALLFLAKLDTSGDLLWTRSGSVGTTATPLCMAVNSSGQTYLGGTHRKTLAFQSVSLPDRVSGNSASTFLFKFDPEGNILWGKQGTNSHRLENSNNFRPIGLALDPAGSAYLAGNYTRESLSPTVTLGFGTQISTLTNSGAFIIRFTPEGEATWIQFLNGANAGEVKSLVADRTGHIYVAAEVNGFNDNQAFQLFRFNCLGQLSKEQWAMGTFTTPWNSVYVDGLAMLPNGRAYLVGNYTYEAIFPSGDSRRPELYLNDRYESKFLASLSPRINPYPSSIYLQPTNQTIASGKALTLNVGAACLGPIRYQWYKNAELIPNATNALLSIPQSTVADSGSYYATLLTCEDLEQSVTVSIQVLDVPSVTSLISEVEVMRGQPLELSFTPAGTPPLSIQWYRNGTLLSGANTPIVTIINAQPKDAGLYYGVITNLAGKTTNVIAHVTVSDSVAVLPYIRSPQIIIQPQDLTRAFGNQFQLEVTVYGKSPFTYQWYKDDAPLLDATNRTFTVNSALVTDTGEYHVVISNDLGTATSRHAKINIVPSVLAPVWPSPGTSFASGLPLTLEVKPGVTYRLQVSSNLSTWTTLQTFQSEQALFNYLDTQAGSRARAFYRLISP